MKRNCEVCDQSLVRGGLWGGRGAALVPLDRRQKEARDPSRGHGEDSAGAFLSPEWLARLQGHLPFSLPTTEQGSQARSGLALSSTLGAWLAHSRDLICPLAPPVKGAPLEVTEEAAAMRQLQDWTLTWKCLGSSKRARQNPEQREKKGQLWALALPSPR